MIRIYKYFKAVFLVAGIILLILGLVIGANFKYNTSEVTFTPFEISAGKTASYGNYADYNQTGVVIRGTILQPQEPIYSNGLRPAVFFFHGMFARKEFHYHYAIELARAGFVVIMPDHGGMGDSVGTFKLGWDIIPLVETVIDHLPVLNTTYNLKINKTQVGSTGHSYGGISTTFAGIYRPYNESEGIGVSACASIWTWSNLTETMEYMIGDYGTAAWDLLYLTNMEHVLGDQYVDNILSSIEARNAIDKVNGTKGNFLPPNWLLITSWDDGLVLPEWQMEIMAEACFDESNPSISSNTYYNYIKSNMTYANNFTWNNSGSFENGSMRKIFLPRGTYGFPQGHLTEGFLVPPLVMILDWFGDAFNWNVSDTITRIESDIYDLGATIPFWPAPVQNLIFEMYLGPILIINGLVLMILPLISYIARGRRRDDEYQLAQFRFPKGTTFSWKETLAFTGIFAGVYLISFAPSIYLSSFIKYVIPYIVADALLATGIFRSIIGGVLLIPLLWVLFDRYGQNYKDIGLDLNKKKLIRGAMVGILVPLIFFGLWDFLNVFTVFPTMLPMPSPTMGYWGFVLVLVFVFITAMIEEIYLRGLIQTKLEAKIQESNRLDNRRLKKWIAYFIMVLLSLGVNTLGISSAIFFAVGPNALYGNIFGLNFGALFFIIGLSFYLIPSILNPYIYQRTRSVWACAIFNMIMLGFLFTCRLGLGITTF
ncbi:MAG: hypothetical protein GF329_15075 [Candidatus Lokiarchaeota archaeon]|nr:hypothetical protein [Candidatus Lokiarchaeota archaeon]